MATYHAAVVLLEEEKFDPILTSIEPNKAYRGDTITLHGNYFGATQGNSRVTVNDILVTDYISWVNDTIVVKVPETTSGNVVVIVEGAENPSNPVMLNIYELKGLRLVNDKSIYIKLGDSEGNCALIIQNADGQDVFSIDSLGEMHKLI